MRYATERDMLYEFRSTECDFLYFCEMHTWLCADVSIELWLAALLVIHVNDFITRLFSIEHCFRRRGFSVVTPVSTLMRDEMSLNLSHRAFSVCVCVMFSSHWCSHVMFEILPVCLMWGHEMNCQMSDECNLSLTVVADTTAENNTREQIIRKKD